MSEKVVILFNTVVHVTGLHFNNKIRFFLSLSLLYTTYILFILGQGLLILIFLDDVCHMIFLNDFNLTVNKLINLSTPVGLNHYNIYSVFI